MSRRKSVLLDALQEDAPPVAGQAIVRAAGSRGTNVMEVEFPCGRSSLALIPARFHKTLWIKRGTFLVVEDLGEGAGEARVTGQIVRVLYAEQVRALRKLAGVWPPEFDGEAAAAPLEGAAAVAAEAQADDAAAALRRLRVGGAAAGERAAGDGDDEGGTDGGAAAGSGSESGSSSDGGLPPLTRIQNRRVVTHAPESSDSESD
jgi:probable RNA-binding protein EIF1AD